MAEENTSTVNLDLNLGPVDNPSDDSGPPSASYHINDANLEDLFDDPVRRVRDAPRHRSYRMRSGRMQLPWELLLGDPPHNGEGSLGSDDRPTEVVKICENVGDLENEALGKRKDGPRSNCDGESFFDCNICLDLATNPVVTCCGHLFCWPCLYRWLHNHSDAKECPVCKGEVSAKNVTPIYGRGNNVKEPDPDPTLKIPIRPQARRVESWRQTIQRSAFSIPMEEMIRRLGNTYELNRELAQLESDESPDISNALLNRILTSRGMRRELQWDDLLETFPPRDNSVVSPLLVRLSSSHRAGRVTAENLADSFLESSAVERNNGDSASSVAAVTESESRNTDSRRRSEASIISESGGSRRRRLN